jgi:hypothetical protein
MSVAVVLVDRIRAALIGSIVPEGTFFITKVLPSTVVRFTSPPVPTHRARPEVARSVESLGVTVAPLLIGPVIFA